MKRENKSPKIFLTLALLLSITASSFAQYDSIPLNGRIRSYLVHLPTSYTGTTPTSLIIAMHGGFGSAANMQNQSQLSTKADAENFIVVYPEGVKNIGIRTWNAGWCCGYASNNNIDDVGFIDVLLDTLIQKYSIDTNRIYATGMSNGGFMSYRLACELSTRIAAIAPVAASMSVTSCNPTRPMPIIHFHSYEDTNIPYLGGNGAGVSNHYNPPLDSVLNAWSNTSSCSNLNDTIVDNAQYTYTKWDNCNCNAEIQYYITHDGGHSWPGGVKTITGDSVSVHVDATDLMWTFFQQHSLICGTTNVNEMNTQNNIELFPNPSNGIINIGFLETNFTVIINNQLGEIIMKKSNPKTINLSNNPNGIYYLTLKTKAETITRKIVKTN